MDLMLLTGRLGPDPTTITDFRRNNRAAIRKTCAEFVQLCRPTGVLKGDTVEGDGSKFMAVNNRDRNFSKGTVANRLAHVEAEVGRYIDEAERLDCWGMGEAGAERTARLTGRDHGLLREIERLPSKERALGHAPDGQISRTDSDARAMAPRAQHSGNVGYNVQSVVDAETHLIVPHEILGCYEGGITATVTRLDMSGSRAIGLFVKPNFACEPG